MQYRVAIVEKIGSKESRWYVYRTTAQSVETGPDVQRAAHFEEDHAKWVKRHARAMRKFSTTYPATFVLEPVE